MEKLKPVKHAPVLIAGAGPVGLTLSALLSRCGVQNVIFEKNAELSQHPQVTSIYTCVISKGKSEYHLASDRRVKIRYQELTKSKSCITLLHHKGPFYKLSNNGDFPTRIFS